MATLSLTDTPADKLSADAVVVGLLDGAAGPTLAGGAESIDKAMNGRLLAALTALGARGRSGEVTRLATLDRLPAPVVAAVGLGRAGDAGPSTEALRRAAGAVTRALAGTREVALTLSLIDADPSAVRAVGEGALLGAYDFDRYRTRSAEGRSRPVESVVLVVAKPRDKALRAAAERTRAVAEAVHHARDLVNTAPNDLPPAVFAEQVATAARAGGLGDEILDEKALRKAGYGGILAVGMGSANPPRLVRLTYRGKRAKAKVALVGKGVTFDSGGLSIKPAQGMWEMKTDMAGAAAVFATALAAARVGLAVSLDAWLPMAENMPGGGSYRPSDVVSMYGGTRVEVLNTDAEGRMLLADAIARAVEEKPDYLLETSTLTGGQVIALGRRYSGVMGQAEFCERVRRAGERSGEPMWPMPFPEEVREGMESEVADISQVNATMDRAGHMLQAGVFLAEFVPEGLSWAHVDVAGPARSPKAHGYTPVGGTGVPARTFVEVLEDIAQNG